MDKDEFESLKQNAIALAKDPKGPHRTRIAGKFSYSGGPFALRCQCGWEMVVYDGVPWICVTELNDNPGPSVTNSHAELRPAIIDFLSQRHPDLDFSKVVFLERYDWRNDEHVSRVELMIGGIDWTHFDLSEYYLLFGHSLADESE